MQPDIQLSDIYTVDTFFHMLRYLTIPGVAFAIFWLRKSNLREKFRIQRQNFVRKDLLREFFSSIMSCFIFAAVTLLLFVEPIRSHVSIYENLEEYGLAWYFLSLPVLILIHDTYFYWMHRFCHLNGIFQLVHQFHHRSLNPSPLASFAFSPVEATLEVIWLIPTLMVIPFHESILLIFAAVSMTINAQGHLGIEFFPSWFRTHPILKWLNTSTHHNDHHSHFHGNYGFYFLFWDKLMGTEKNDSKPRTLPVELLVGDLKSFLRTQSSQSQISDDAVA